MTESTKVDFIQINAHSSGQRLDNFLLSYCKGVPKSKIYQIIRTGQVRINKKRAKPLQRLQCDDIVRVPPLRQSEDASKPQRLSVSRQAQLQQAILFEDDAYLIVNKPRFYAVHAGTGIQQGLIEQYALLRPDLPYLQLGHRLDRETTGCLVLAKSRPALLGFQAQINHFQVEKHYLVLVHGQWPAERMRIAEPLKRIKSTNGEPKVIVSPEGKPSETHIRLVATRSNASLLDVSLVTGRMHQVRVHCQHQGFPIIGDPKYSRRQLDVSLAFNHPPVLGLHARSIAFHASGKSYAVQAPPDAAWIQMANALGFDITGGLEIESQA